MGLVCLLGGARKALDNNKITVFVCVCMLLTATIRAARAFDIRRVTTTIRNNNRKDTRGRKEVADLCRHGTRDERFVKGKGGKVGKAPNLGWNGTTEIIAMQLQEFHGRENANVIDATRQLIVIDICKLNRGAKQKGEKSSPQQDNKAHSQQTRYEMQRTQLRQVCEGEKFIGETASQLIKVQIQKDQFSQKTHFGRNGGS